MLQVYDRKVPNKNAINSALFLAPKNIRVFGNTDVMENNAVSLKCAYDDTFPPVEQRNIKFFVNGKVTAENVKRNRY